jgi:hypothetical protein
MTASHRHEITIATEQQFFNSMDPAPFRKRELDPAVVDYIVAWAEKAPSSADFGLTLRIAAPTAGEDVQAIITEAVAENFRRLAADTRRKLNRLFHDGRISLVIGVAFVAVAITVGDWLSTALRNAHYAQIIADSFVIGAWVALWHPTNIFLYDWWPLRRQALLYDRLSRMDVEIVTP